MRNYYELLDVKPTATPVEVRANFRRLVARYHAATPINRVFADSRFRAYLNAYLTLSSSKREAYDGLLREATPENPPQPEPLETLPLNDRRLLMAQIAYWRRENVEAIHLLRELLEKERQYAKGWALLGEIYFSIGRLEEGIKAYERAVQADPDTHVYAARLQEARDALAGIADLTIESSPEEELLREERRKRWRKAAAILLLGLGFVLYAFLTPIKSIPEALNIPWGTVWKQLFAIFFLMLGLSYGRFIESFDREMVWNTISAGDRGVIHRYPYGIILFATSFASLLLASVTLLITAFMDEEWPMSASVMIFLCLLLNVALGLMLYFTRQPWGNTLVFGGNLLTYAAMLGWAIGSLNTQHYE